MRIDVHNHLGYDPESEEGRKSRELVEEMDKSDVDKCVVFPFTTNPDFIEQNTRIKEAFNEYPDRIIGFFTMNPNLTEMTDLMQNYCAEGFKGVVTDPRFGVNHNEKLFHELVECALILDIPVWLHFDEDLRPFTHPWLFTLNPIESLLAKYPSVNFILSSFCFDVVSLTAKYKNVFMDTSSLDYGNKIAEVTMPIGTYRVLMGTNTPYGSLLRKVDTLMNTEFLTKFQKDLVAGHNLKRLLKL